MSINILLGKVRILLKADNESLSKKLDRMEWSGLVSPKTVMTTRAPAVLIKLLNESKYSMPNENHISCYVKSLLLLVLFFIRQILTECISE